MAEPLPGGDPGRSSPRQHRVPDPGAVARPWVEVYPPGVPPTYTLPNVPVARLVDDAARDFPDTPGIVVGDHVLDHATVAARIEDLAQALLALGIRPTDVIGLALPRSLLTAVLLPWAVWRVGAILLADQDGTGGVAPDVLIGTRRAVHDWIQGSDASPRLVVRVTGDEWPEPGPARRWWRRPGSSPLRRRRPRAASRADSDEVSLAAALAEAGPGATGGMLSGVAVPTPNAPALLLPTETGQLRQLDHAALVANAFQARLWVPDVQAGRERVLVTGSLWRGPGLTFGMLATMLGAGTLDVLDAPDADGIARRIAMSRPTILVADAEHLTGLAELAAGGRDLGSLRVVWTGRQLDPMVVAVLEERTAGARVRYGYGLGDGTLLTHGQPVYGRIVSGALGLPVTGTVAAVVDPAATGQVRPPGRAGVLAVHGPQLGHDDAGSSWWLTDDIVTMDSDGWFRRLGHRDEVLDRDGDIVALPAVEATLASHPGVRAAGAVIGVEGSLEVAVVLRRRQRPTHAQLVAHCAETLGSKAVPDRLAVVDELPRTEAGAIDRAALRTQLAAGDSA